MTSYVAVLIYRILLLPTPRHNLVNDNMIQRESFLYEMLYIRKRVLDVIRLVYWNNKHTIAKVRKNANRRGGKNATVTK